MHRGLGVSLLLLSACSGSTVAARDQWTVVIATDAPLPQFGDRMLVEILNSQGNPACAGCRRELGVPATWPASFGIVPIAGVPSPHVRIRLYRSDIAGPEGEPLGSALIDARGVLPPPHGDTRAYVPLMMDCFGVPSTTDSACDPQTGKLSAQHVLGPPPASVPQPGSWAPAATRPCRGALPKGMVCVPGGAFLLGSPESFSLGQDLASTPEHVVELSPFAMDLNEASVGTLRSLVLAGKLSAPAVTGAPYCTWLGTADASNDAMPLNCVTWSEAKSVCAALGKRLPTEAEWEFAASNRTLETRYPWGDDGSNICGKSDVGLGDALDGDPTFCLTTGKKRGPQPGGDEQDVTQLGILNLGGNLTEWVDDWFAPYTAPCWNKTRPLVNPRCDEPASPFPARSIRGSSWRNIELLAAASVRDEAGANVAQADIGFRCVLSR